MCKVTSKCDIALRSDSQERLSFLFLILLGSRSGVSDFIPFGVNNGDEERRGFRADHSNIEGPFQLQVPIVLFQNKETSYYVSTTLVASL